MNIVTNIVTKVYAKAMPFSHKIYNALSPDALKLFASFFTIWFLYHLVWHFMVKGDGKLPELLKKFALFSFICSFLKNGRFFKDWVVEPIMSMVDGIIVTILENGLGENLVALGNSRNHNGMLYAVDQCLNQIINIYVGINHGASLFNPDLLIAGLFLMAPYLVMTGMFACYVLEYIFKVAAITAISPLLLICLGFSPTRGAFTGGIRMLFQGALNLIIAVFFMTLVLHLVNGFIGDLPNLTGTELYRASGKWLYSDDFWGCLLLGGIACLLLSKSPALASAITNVTDTASAAAIISSTGAAMFMKAGTGVGGMASKGVQAMGSLSNKMNASLAKSAPKSKPWEYI